MITREPSIAVGIMEHCATVSGRCAGTFDCGGQTLEGKFEARPSSHGILLVLESGATIGPAETLRCQPRDDATFTLCDVTIGIGFHWERKEEQTFRGGLRILTGEDGLLVVINDIAVEEYLTSVISSEMSAEAPVELLRAHAITSRSWLVAMLEREQRNVGVPSRRSIEHDGELIRWYDREDHALFDVCADDHCQRYQGITRIIAPAARLAVQDTRGTFLVDGGQICDARFSKACGGISEAFENTWEATPVSYLVPVSDAAVRHVPPAGEEDAVRWIRSSPEAYCNTTDGSILRQVLPSFDQETTDFFRWTVAYGAHDLRTLLQEKSGIDFGTIHALVPVERGPSGRIVRLRIDGSLRSLIVGKELEIRRWFSKSHLYSSAFYVATDGRTPPATFTLHGAGWGHGVGLCQIGAAVMAAKGFRAEEIVRHYFCGAALKTLY